MDNTIKNCYYKCVLIVVSIVYSNISLVFLLSFSKSQSLTNTFTETLRGNPVDDEAKAETIRSLRQSFASLFSD